MNVRVAMVAFLAGCGIACGGRALTGSSEPPAGRDPAAPREASTPDVVAGDSRPPDDTGGPDEAGVPEFDGPLTPWDAQSAGCVANNLIDHDSFDVIGAAIEACLAGDAAVACAKGSDSLTLTGLAQGVDPVAIEYGTAPDGTHLLEVRGTLVPHMPMVIFRASGVPADVSFDDALLAFFSPRATPSFPCTYD